MKCEKCKRPLTEAEPVYCLFLKIWERWRMVCGDCEATAKHNRPAAWFSSRPCDRCKRPIFLHRATRKGLRYLVCGIECRQAVHNANFRRRHPRARVERQCHGCGTTFKPKRSDTLFCKAACKQKAYRRRRGADLGRDGEAA